jgi:hypothetical protein
MVNLNTLVPANSSLELEERANINDRGEIAGRGFPARCDDIDACGHAFFLIPCDNAASCETKAEGTTAAVQEPTTPISKASNTSAQAARTPM